MSRNTSNARNARNARNANVTDFDAMDVEADAIIAAAEAEAETLAAVDAIEHEAQDAIVEALPADLRAEVESVRQGLAPRTAPAVAIDDDTRVAMERAAIVAVRSTKVATGRWIYTHARDGFLNVPREQWTDRVVELLPDGTCRYGAAVVSIGNDGEPVAGATCRTHMMGRGTKAVGPCRWRSATSDDLPRSVWPTHGQQTADGTEATFIVHIDSEGEGYQRGAVLIEGKARAFKALFIAADA